MTGRTVLLAGLRDSPQPTEPPQAQLVALALAVADGTTVWSQPLPAAPVPWGLILDRNGHIVVSLQGGGLVCFTEAK